jgi:hypothetical protein
MVSALSPQEIIFWISLFGMDIGIPLMLPERWRFQIGVITTALSAGGLVWSLGYRMSLHDHVGWQAALIFMGIGGLASVVSAIPREPNLSIWLYAIAELIEIDVERIYRRETTLTEMEQHRALARYQKNGNLAAKLVFEVVPFQSTWRYSPYYKLVKSLKRPQSLEEVRGMVKDLNALAEMAPKSRLQRFISDAFRGMLFGGLAFGVLHFVAVNLL